MKYPELIEKWVANIGIGFDPICRACDYDIPFEAQDAIEYDRDIGKLWIAYGTMGDLEGAILDEMTKQGLIP